MIHVRYSALATLALLVAAGTTARAQSFMSIGADEGVREVMPELEGEGADPDDPVAKPTAGVGSVNYEQHAASGTREGGREGMVAMDQLTVGTGFPIFFDGPRTMLAVGLMYGRTRFEYQGTNIAEDMFHTFKTTLTFRHDIDERWGLLLRYQPNLTTNMSSVTMGHVTHGAQIIGTYQLGPTETLYFGLAFSQQLRPIYVLPGAGYELFTGRFHLEVRAPEKIDFGYMLTPRIEVGATARYQNTMFGIGGVAQLDRMSYTTAWAGATLDVRVVAGLYLRAAVGRTVMRRFRGRDDGEETRAIALEQTMIGRVALAYEVDR